MRPTEYDPSYCERVIEMGAEGKSVVEIAYELGHGKTTLYRWREEHPEFRAALTRAKEAEQVWWEKKGRENLEKPVFQASMWSRSMAARFPDDWREKQDIDLTGKIQVTEVKRTIVDPRNTDT